MSGPPPIPRHAQVPPPIPASAASSSSTPATPPPIPPTARRRVALAPPKTLSNLELVFRVAMGVLLVASVVLVWWSYTQRLQPLQQKSRALAAETTKLSTRVEELERKWAKSDIDKIRADYREAYVKLFADETALRAWLDHLEELAVPLALDLKVDVGKPIANTNTLERLAVIPTSIFLDVRPSAAGSETPYQRLLRFTQALAAEGKRADLAELDASGGTESISRAVLIFNLWAGEASAP